MIFESEKSMDKKKIKGLIINLNINILLYFIILNIIIIGINQKFEIIFKRKCS